MERIYAVVQGQVQGVGFRWFVQSLANSLQITGWIRNMENGMVEMELQGETAALHQLLKSGFPLNINAVFRRTTLSFLLFPAFQSPLIPRTVIL